MIFLFEAVGIALAVALVIKLGHALVMPLKPHRLCRGKGLDTFCNLRGKVPRFGARWVRPRVWREYH